MALGENTCYAAKGGGGDGDDRLMIMVMIMKPSRLATMMTSKL